MKNLRYTPKISAALLHLSSFLIVFLLFMGRKKARFRSDALLQLFPDFYQHVSNFCISFMLLSGIGYTWLILGLKLKYVLLLAAAILAANFIYELWIGVLNTPDLVDAYYGFWGTLSACMILALIKKYGLKALPLTENQDNSAG